MLCMSTSDILSSSDNINSTTSLFWCILCMATPDILSSSDNINNTAHVSRLCFLFLWLCYYTGKRKLLFLMQVLGINVSENSRNIQDKTVYI